MSFKTKTSNDGLLSSLASDPDAVDACTTAFDAWYAEMEAADKWEDVGLNEVFRRGFEAASPPPRVLLDEWFELKAPNGEHIEAYSALPPPIGKAEPQRFSPEDLQPTKDMNGQPYEDNLSEVDRVKRQYKKYGPFKIVRIRRYAV